MGVQRTLPTLVGTVSGAIMLAALLGHAQGAPQAPAPPAGGGRGGGDNSAALWTLLDADKDGSITRAEMKGAFDKWYDAADTAKSGSVTTEQLGPALEHGPGAASPGGPGRRPWRRTRRRRAPPAGPAPRAAAAATCRRRTDGLP